MVSNVKQGAKRLVYRCHFGAGCQIRTDDLSLTRRLLWPTELNRQYLADAVRFELTDRVNGRRFSRPLD
jgi:hypothetical protein